ncbi:hypothetical protein RJ639_025571 [Escallonia herrerae]|uniref:Retrovirus-related Pol polyprotein from transposon TNT 1-94 n=1 Tax=Escallonia herrerae TaxID=1293975 RepID=A0AA88UXG3_9ASTE|nr:hypothetical protein RJ639_025571 [Escallonia herrerae]
MHDGIVRTLTDVMHVPELRKNLISLGTFDSNGCSYRAADGVMMIMKGSLVVMKGLKQNSLYLLKGSTVTGASTTTLSSNIDSNTTKLWHMSERAKGFAQKEGIDYNEIFSPVVKHSSTRVLLAMVALYDLELEQPPTRCVIGWKATLQTIVALSTTNAEYIAATEAVKEAIWLKGLVGDLGLKQECSTVYCDSQGSIHLTKNQMFHERTKHIDVRNGVTRWGEILCPCRDFVNGMFQSRIACRDHLIIRGFMPNYTVWRVHGEALASSSIQNENENNNNEPGVAGAGMHEMVNDIFVSRPGDPSVQVANFYKYMNNAR